jgi:hypothetical protein
VITLHRKGVKRWLSHAERGDAVAASLMATPGERGVVVGGRAAAGRRRVRVKVKLYKALGRLRNRRGLLFNGIGFDGGRE